MKIVWMNCTVIADRSGQWPNLRHGDYDALARVFADFESQGAVIIDLNY